VRSWAFIEEDSHHLPIRDRLLETGEKQDIRLVLLLHVYAQCLRRGGLPVWI
jgi:hypothetical protein